METDFGICRRCHSALEGLRLQCRFGRCIGLSLLLLLASRGGLFLVISGCRTIQSTTQTTSVPKPSVPEFHFDSDTLQVQKRGGVVMRLELITPEVKREIKTVRENENHQYETRDANNRIITEAYTTFDLIETPYYVLKPEEMKFSIKITNQLGHTLKLAESVFTLTLAGKLVHLEKDCYREFTNAIIPRGQEDEIKIDGPLWADLPKTGTLRIALDDIAVEVDDANKATKREHFEWIISFQNKSNSSNEEIHRKYMIEDSHGLRLKGKTEFDPENPLVKKFIGPNKSNP